MNEFYESVKVIQAHEVDFTNRLRIDSLFILLQDTAASHADLLNLGYSALIEHNLAWVLSWAKVEIDSLPGFGEEIKIKTWPKKKYMRYSLRDFYVFSNDRIIIKATTAWLPINIKSKRIIDTSALPAPINYQENLFAIDELPQRVHDSDNMGFVFTKKIRYTDIDLNQHVNNIQYIELILDSFPKEQFEIHRIKNIEINFISESRFNDEIEVFRSTDESGVHYTVAGVNKESSKTIFQARVEWKAV